MKAFLVACRGHGQRFYVPDFAYTQRGAFPAAELLTNSDLSSGTTGWTAQAATLSAADSDLRISSDGTFSASPAALQSTIAATQYAPFAARALVTRGVGALGSGGAYLAYTGVSATDYSAALGLRTASLVNGGTTLDYAAVAGNAASGFGRGDFAALRYSSLARCAQVDNGQNLFQRSVELDNAYWTKSNATVSANADQAPDGSTAADRLVEDSSTAVHSVSAAATVTSSAQDICITIAARAQGRDFLLLRLTEATGGTSADTYFDLATGVVGTGATGANWSMRRAAIKSLGAGWYQVSMIARKTNAATSVTGVFALASADGTSSYLGGGSSAVRLWRATMAISGVPVRLVATTSAATTGTSQTGGALHLKGLPASTSGLLLASDWAEVIAPTYSELKRVTAPLNSDAAGLGYLQFEPTLRNSPADGAAVIIQKPMAMMMLDSNTVRWADDDEGFCDLEFTAVEDLA